MSGNKRGLRAILAATVVVSLFAPLAEATAGGIREIATAINEPGGMNAVNLRVAEQYIGEFGNLAKTNNSIIIPTDLSDIAGMIKSATSVIKQTGTVSEN